MLPPDLLKIFIAAIGFGLGGEALRRYRGFKARRRSMPRHERNAGFWTDKRLYQAEGLFAAGAFGAPFSVAIPLLAADRENFWFYTYPALIVYVLLIYLLMRGMNMDEPQ